MSGRRFWEFFERSTPLPAKGGIKAQSRRGGFAANWWARRWIAVLESFHVGARLARGRSYARQGQVLSLDVEAGVVRATVQGSRPRPYTVEVRVKALTEAQWRKVAAALGGEALRLAKLLAGEMPQDIEEVFSALDLPLLPARRGDLATTCSCPDVSNPCKHIAAVYYLLGEAFDRDPFLMFRMRGMGREEFLALLDSESGPEREPLSREPLSLEPLSRDPAAFWQGKDIPADLLGGVASSLVPAALLQQLGPFPLWQGEGDLVKTLEPAYGRAAVVGLEVLVRRGGSVQE